MRREFVEPLRHPVLKIEVDLGAPAAAVFYCKIDLYVCMYEKQK